MKKLKEIEVEVKYVPQKVFDDGMFDDNICPTCGYNIKNIIPSQYNKKGFFKTLYYRETFLKCPECKTEFRKRINDKYELNSCRTIISSAFLLLLIASLFLFILYCILSCFDKFFIPYLIASCFLTIIGIVFGSLLNENRDY